MNGIPFQNLNEGGKFAPLTVALTTWCNAASIRECLSAIGRLPLSELLVCDCGSRDDTMEIVGRECSDAVILSQGRDLSFAQARNLALRRASTPHVLFIEGDWRIDAAGLKVLRRKLTESPDACMAVPCFRDSDGSIQVGHNVRRFPTGAALRREYLLLHKLWGRDAATTAYRMLDFDHRGDRIVDHACGAVVLAKREPLIAAGGYDERYSPAWVEDVDLSWRLCRQGWRTWFCCDAAAHHLGRETTRHFLIEARYDQFYSSVLRYCRTYLGSSWQSVRFCLALGLLAKMSFAYLTPAPIRRRLLTRCRIYNSDQAIQSYRHMYARALREAFRGAPNVQPCKPFEAGAGLSDGASSSGRQTASSHT